jgi:Na+-translocating ferredoxin:NAD+ oxidoreductase RnfE subunit
MTTGTRRIDPRKLCAPATPVEGIVWGLGNVVVVVVVGAVLEINGEFGTVVAPQAAAMSATAKITSGVV